WFFSKQVASTPAVAFGTEKSITTSTGEVIVAASGTPRGDTPAMGPMSWPRLPWAACSSAAATSSSLSALASATRRCPMRPAAPLIAIRVATADRSLVRSVGWSERLAVELDRLDDLVDFVGHGHGPIGKRGPLHSAASQHLVELILIRGVVG